MGAGRVREREGERESELVNEGMRESEGGGRESEWVKEGISESERESEWERVRGKESGRRRV